MRTALFDQHVRLGAKITHFANFEMPLFYEGVLSEHEVVRSGCGIFDISHMGLLEFRGARVEEFVEYLTVSKVLDKPVGTAIYSMICNEEGGVIDDLILYKFEDHFWCVVNAANREKDLNHFQKFSDDFGVEVNLVDMAILALQGPKSEELLKFKLKRFTTADFKGGRIAATGYTGEKGFEIYLPVDQAETFFLDCLEKGAIPCGLGARDTLRLEMGYALYGHELREEISPLESVAAWAVKMDKENFVGKAVLLPPEREPIALFIEGGVARASDPIFQNNEEIGIVTSGNFSPSLKRPIALGLVKKGARGDLQVKIRNRFVSAIETKLPFYRGN